MSADPSDPFGAKVIARLTREAAPYTPPEDVFAPYFRALRLDYEEREAERLAGCA